MSLPVVPLGPGYAVYSVSQNFLVLDTAFQRLAKLFGPGYSISLTFQNVLKLDMTYP